MTFEITVNFKKAIVFLSVHSENEGIYKIRRRQVLSDEVTPFFPAVLELVRENKSWHFEKPYQPYFEIIIPALEHYLAQQQRTKENPFTGARIKLKAS